MIKKLQQGGYYDVNVENGDNYHIYPSALRSNEIDVTTPEVIVRGKAPGYRSKLITNSAFNPTDVFEPVHGALELMGRAFNKATDATGTTNVAQTVMPWLMPSQYIGWARTGNRPGTNTGFGDSKEDQYLSEMFDLGVAPAIMKGAGNVTKMVGKTGINELKKIPKYPETTELNQIYPERGWLKRLIKNKKGVWYSTNPYKDFGKKKYSVNQIKRNYLEAKRDIYKYFSSPEFKERALNAGFTESEIPELINEINENLKGTTFNPLNIPSNKNALGINTGSVATNKYRVKIKRSKRISKENLRENLIHEIMHSIGGKTSKPLNNSNPMLRKLREYNDKITPIQEEELNKTLRFFPGDIKNFVKNQGYSDWYSNAFAKRNKMVADNLYSEIMMKPYEFRSRMAVTLDYLRNKGYNTAELIKDPSKFKMWIENLRKSKANVPNNLNQLLQVTDIDALANYASKMLSTTGGIYLGSKNVK